MSTIKGANTLSSGYDVANSCRFDGSSSYMTLTPGSAGSQKIVTFSTWLKRGKIAGGGGGEEFIMYGRPGTDTDTRLYFTGDGDANDDKLVFQSTTNNTSHTFLITNRKFRDPSAWYHIVISTDTTVSTPGSSNIRMFINGVQETSFATETYGAQNKLFYWTDDALHTIGRRSDGASNYFSGYLAETVLIDGTAYAASDFGEFDEDSPTIWKPKDVSGLTFGTNGFYLDYEASDNLGNDANGGTDFSESGLAATDQTTDTPTNNFATLNPLVKGNTSFTFLEGNLQVDSGNNWGHGAGTIGLANGKWYWEVDNITAASNVFFGICSEKNLSHLDNDSTPYSENGLMLYFQDGRRTIDGSDSEGEYTAYGTTHGFALDLDSGTRTIKFYRDNSLEGTENLTANFVAGEFVFPVLLMSASSNACGVDYNFGNEVTALASGAADANGYGNFEFAPPSGYYAICSKNLAEYG